MSAQANSIVEGKPAYRDWVDAAIGACAEVFEITFGVEPPEVISETDAPMAPAKGATITMVSDNEDVEVIFAATPENTQRAARMMFFVEPDEPDLPDEDVGDGIGEIANMIAGGVKDRLSFSRTIRLGLPIQFSGVIKTGKGERTHFVHMKCDDLEFQLGIFHRQQ